MEADAKMTTEITSYIEKMYDDEASVAQDAGKAIVK